MAKPARPRIKACEHCKVESSTLYRVVYDESGAWALICNPCRAKLEHQSFYRYSGTWKADKRL
uniref:hypothetical protein n=1 Tax=Orrella sp. TaxID=1921583 RepID=UPI0040483859